MKARSAKIYTTTINEKEYEYVKVRDKHGVSRRNYKRICISCGKEEWLRGSWINKNRLECFTCANKKGPTEEVKKQISQTLRKKYSDPSYKELFVQQQKERGKKKRGKNHWNWKGGITNKNTKIRNSQEYSLWRKKVFERDLYHCRICEQNTDNLQAHHIKPFSVFPDLMFNLENGITLCLECHNKIHKYYNEIQKNGNNKQVSQK